MAHVILGLLLITPQSLYDLIRSFEAGISLFYSASSGSLKRALDRLLEQGHIEILSTEASGRGRKVYQVTDEGRQAFHEWITGELSGPDPETAALSRLFFLGLLDPSERPEVLRRITTRLEADLTRLEDVQDRLTASEVPEEWREVAAHQHATLDYGLATHRHSLDWFRRYLQDVEIGS